MKQGSGETDTRNQMPTPEAVVAFGTPDPMNEGVGAMDVVEPYIFI